MSTLKADTIQSTGGGAATLTKQSAAKTFSVFEPDVAATTASLNISGITDNGAGDFSHAFTSAFGAAKQYTFAGSCGNTSNSTGAIEYCKPREEPDMLASSVRTLTGYVAPSGATVYDYPNSSFAIHGDLA